MRLVISTAFQRFSNTTAAGANFVELIQSFVGDMQSFRVATTEAKRPIEQQKASPSEARKYASNASNNVSSLQGEFKISNNGEGSIFANALAGTSQIARNTTQLPLVLDPILVRTRELTKIALMKT